MGTGNIERAKGSSGYKDAFGTADVAPGDAIDTGLDSIETVQLTANGSNGTINATYSNLSDGTVTVQHNGTGGGTETVAYRAIGE